MLVVTRYAVEDAAAFRASAVDALRALAERPGCTGARLARAIDDDTAYLLVTEWESVGAYRRALGAYEVKVAAVPVLTTATDEPSAYEVLYDAHGPTDALLAGDRAQDAGEVRVGEASGPGAGWVPEHP